MKILIICAVLITAFGIQNVFSQTAVDRGNPKTHTELIKVAKEIHNAELLGQKETLQKRTAKDFMLCGPSGELVKRDAYLNISARSFSEYGFSLDDVWLIDRGDTAVLVYVIEINMKLDGKQTSIRQRISDVFNKTAAGWELVSSQRTNISESAPKSASKGPVKM